MPLFTPELEFSDDYPTIEPSLRLDFANARALDPRITFTRASTATYVGKDGLIKTAGNDEPRFDHDPTTGESLGLLIEESRTNILGLSSNLTDNNGVDWDAVNGTIAVNQTTAPDGTTTAASFTTTAGNAEHSVVFSELVPTGNHTASVWVKTNTYSIVSFVLYGEANSLVSYNLNTETVYNQGSNVSRATITEYPNGWYRISATMNCTVSNSRVYRLFASTGNFDASGTESFYYWGPQVESGNFETSYIPTFTSNTAVTRAVDTAQINSIQFHNPSEFVLYAAGRSNTGASDTSSSTTGCLVSLGDTTNDYRFMLRKYRYNSGSGVNTGFTFRYRNVADGINMDMFPNYYDGLSDGYDTTTIAPIWDDFNTHRSALAFEAGVSTDNIRGCADGILVVPAVTTPGSYSTVSNPTPYTQATTLQIGTGSSSGPFNGTISEVRYYPKRLTNTQLQTLTQ